LTKDREAHGLGVSPIRFCEDREAMSDLRPTPRPYRLSLWRRALNAVVRPLARLGLTGPRTHLLTVPGRRSGRPWSTPVSIVRDGEQRWLVAPYGDRNWVRNARVAGRVELRRGRWHERFAVEELAPADAVPVLRRYYELGRVTRPFFRVSLESPHEDWLVEAHSHPVFSLRPVR
jgi:deazaflavin-dependent oxidoreductase (nitroreductase family)